MCRASHPKIKWWDRKWHLFQVRENICISTAFSRVSWFGQKVEARCNSIYWTKAVKLGAIISHCIRKKRQQKSKPATSEAQVGKYWRAKTTKGFWTIKGKKFKGGKRGSDLHNIRFFCSSQQKYPLQKLCSKSIFIANVTTTTLATSHYFYFWLCEDYSEVCQNCQLHRAKKKENKNQKQETEQAPTPKWERLWNLPPFHTFLFQANL